ncbi:hypothetical protein B0H17DRAFT_1030712 [Mycena rosella]|uniref:PIN domain-containing protein n=1 Tax=Mycena rosella TaxID=1033263 RepID=A0AAD7MB01_MYCRO|nr:hypothetical protein B0H17DRAFT_1030712 [Mycena rosella]
MTLMHPSAIWLYLAQFFTQDVLASLMTADRTTRALLGERVAASLEQYRELDFRFLHPEGGTAERLWRRTVADHIRVLRIGPYFVCDALAGSRDLSFTDTVSCCLAWKTREDFALCIRDDHVGDLDAAGTSWSTI